MLTPEEIRANQALLARTHQFILECLFPDVSNTRNSASLELQLARRHYGDMQKVLDSFAPDCLDRSTQENTELE